MKVVYIIVASEMDSVAVRLTKKILQKKLLALCEAKSDFYTNIDKSI